MNSHPDKELIALGIRQPWAELILRGIKTIEVRSLPTSIRGPIYVYASKRIADTEPARAAATRHKVDVDVLPRGVLVGTVEIVDCRVCIPSDSEAACLPSELLKGKQGWRLANPQRLETPLKVRFLPYGVWFYPFKRKKSG
jgi:hypothetical protein